MRGNEAAKTRGKARPRRDSSQRCGLAWQLVAVKCAECQPPRAMLGSSAAVTQIQDEWLWGWDRTPGIVSVWADTEGHATVWRRDPSSRLLVREEERFRPWLLLASLVDLEHLGGGLRPESEDRIPGGVSFQELEGAGGLRYVVRA